MTDNVYRYDIRATHKSERKIQPFTYNNEKSRAAAVRSLNELRNERPEYRFALVARLHGGTEVVLDHL